MSAPGFVVTDLPKKAMEALLALGTTKLMLATATFVPTQDTLDFINDVTNEATGTSYSAGGITMTGVVVNLNASTNLPTVDADDITTAGLSVSCQWGIIYVDTGTPATSPVLALWDWSEGLGGNVTFNGVAWDPDGIIPFAVAEPA